MAFKKKWPNNNILWTSRRCSRYKYCYEAQLQFIGGVPAPDYGAQIWDGEIDDVSVYSRVLSAAEIKALYNLSD